jgi:hypothetical protein
MSVLINKETNEGWENITYVVKAPFEALKTKFRTKVKEVLRILNEKRGKLAN